MTPKDVQLHPAAICESDEVGGGTRIWANAHVLPGARIGRDCNLNDGVFVENDVVVGDRVTLKCGVYLWDGTRLADDVFVGPNATFTNDHFPRSREYPERFLETVVEAGASIGANATILPGIRVGERAMVGAGSVVTRDVPANAIVAGNPARIVGYVDTRHVQGDADTDPAADGTAGAREVVGGARLVPITTAKDLRGSLSAASFPTEVPFVSQRCFAVYDVPSKDVRGEHAHRTCEQFLICLRGSVAVVVDDGRARGEVLLDRPSVGLYLPPLTWGSQYKYSADALLLVLASDPYDDADYVRSYAEFLRLRGEADVVDGAPPGPGA